MLRQISLCVSGILFLVGYLLHLSFWAGLIFGHYYFAYGEGLDRGWTCYAPQDKDVKEPWNNLIPENERPDSYHDVGDNFKLCARFGFYTYVIIGAAIFCV